MSNIENSKNSSFLNFEVNNKHDYQLIKAGKKVFNINKKQLYKSTHSRIVDFFIQPKNNYALSPFGKTQFYIDFDIPKIDYTLHQFVLQFKISNYNSSYAANLMPLPLMIEKVSLLKDSATFGNDTLDYDIFLYNLNKVSNEYKNNNVSDLGLYYNNGQLVNLLISPNSFLNINLELPINLNRSNILASYIKKDLTLRVYFKSNVVYSGIDNLDLQLSNVQLALRVKEVSNEALKIIKSQPKISHLFNKRIITKLSLSNVVADQQYSFNFAGINALAGAAFVYLTKSDYNINYTSLGNLYWHLLNVSINNVYITDSSGKNIFDSNIQFDKTYNNYLTSNHFKKFYSSIKCLCNDVGSAELSQFYYIPLSADGSDLYNESYSGGIQFTDSGNYKINFKALNSYSGNLTLNIMFFCPSVLDVTDNDIHEY